MQSIPDSSIQHNGNAMLPTSLLPSIPEAPCSVNMKFAIGVGGQMAQATGRGITGAEAARNLRDTIEATRYAFAPPAPLTREERLGALLACGLSRAVAKGDLALAERLSKAAVLVLVGAVEPGERAGVMAVRSQRDSTLWYEVEGMAQCSCPDSKKHRTDETKYFCKHSFAVILAQKLNAGTASTPA